MNNRETALNMMNSLLMTRDNQEITNEKSVALFTFLAETFDVPTVEETRKVFESGKNFNFEDFSDNALAIAITRHLMKDVTVNMNVYHPMVLPGWEKFKDKFQIVIRAAHCM